MSVPQVQKNSLKIKISEHLDEVIELIRKIGEEWNVVDW